MWLDNVTTQIAVDFLNDMVTVGNGSCSFNPDIWDWKDLLEGCTVQIQFSIDIEDDRELPIGVYVDLVDDRGITSGFAYRDGINPASIAEAVKAARQDLLRRKEG